MTCHISSRRHLPSKEALHRLFEFRDGGLYWRRRPSSDFKDGRRAAIWNAMCAGKRAGGHHSKGYRDVCIDGVRFLEHRIIASMFLGDLGDCEVDHIDGNKLNNLPSNLRLCRHHENAVNRPGLRNNLPKHVYFSKREQKFKVAMRAGGSVHHIGTFATMDEASFAARSARQRLHGDFRHD